MWHNDKTSNYINHDNNNNDYNNNDRLLVDSNSLVVSKYCLLIK